ncbi:hypothetical protein P152DRAFT_60253 [Eremomyces bilateralis CBS 781.70]|uniref:Uncharacterized protein n=1 Tax=Eremomyces bilateralis CBS 781.70 TaxID=1392243 RepID=A0A6G1G0X2_9PEZI|nr:uncharacterized protein P152DRAFT_60253 [Eremomyces bilateralis CBS 781.70]KAF1811576.1 hypothetical protein P152DRAFT_60253 [Eremomyces bilateralis CBS 781.70]
MLSALHSQHIPRSHPSSQPPFDLDSHWADGRMRMNPHDFHSISYLALSSIWVRRGLVTRHRFTEAAVFARQVAPGRPISPGLELEVVRFMGEKLQRDRHSPGNLGVPSYLYEMHGVGDPWSFGAGPGSIQNSPLYPISRFPRALEAFLALSDISGEGEMNAVGRGLARFIVDKLTAVVRGERTNEAIMLWCIGIVEAQCPPKVKLRALMRVVDIATSLRLFPNPGASMMAGAFGPFADVYDFFMDSMELAMETLEAARLGRLPFSMLGGPTMSMGAFPRASPHFRMSLEVEPSPALGPPSPHLHGVGPVALPRNLMSGGPKQLLMRHEDDIEDLQERVDILSGRLGLITGGDFFSLR